MKQSKFILIPQYFGSLVYNRQSCRYSAFDKESTGLFILSASKPVLGMIDLRYEKEKKEAAIRFVEAYREIGHFNQEGLFCGQILDVTPPAGHITGPLTIHLEITAECNLACQHCFASDSKNRNLLSLEELDSLFMELAFLGSYRLGITGGEPLVRKDVFDIIDLANSHGLQPCMTTNGLLVTKATARELGKRDFIWLNVSLDGASSETNDAIRGPGTFHEILKRVKILGEHAAFSLAFTVTRKNIQEMQAFCELAHSLGAKAVVFRPLYPVGRASNRVDLMPEFSDYVEALEKLDKTAAGQADLCSIHAWGPGTRHDRQAIVYETFGCGAGNTSCSISSNGDISPCSFLGEEYQAGNLREKTFKWIWDSSAMFRDIRNLQGDLRCETCQEYNICGGGCRARAFAICKSINAADPWCNAQRLQTIMTVSQE